MLEGVFVETLLARQAAAKKAATSPDTVAELQKQLVRNAILLEEMQQRNTMTEETAKYSLQKFANVGRIHEEWQLPPVYVLDV